MNKKISVIIPSYNSSKFLSDISVPSAQNQTYKNLEIIVIDDGSTDDTKSVVENLRLNDDRVIYFYQDNRGQASARNFGIKKATGDYVAFLDADDYWHDMKIEKQVKIMEGNPDAGFCFCDYFVLDEDDKYYKKQDPGKDFFVDTLMAVKSALPSTLLIKREVFEKIGYFDERPELRYIEDIDFIIRLSNKEKFAYLPEALIDYRASESHESNDRLSRFFDLMELCSNKYIGVLSENKKKLSNQFRFLGSGFIKTKRLKKGRQYLIKSIRNNRTNYLSFIYLLLSAFGSGFYNFAFLLKKKICK